MLQELRATVTAATELAAEIGERLRAGDPAPEHTARLAALVAAIELGAARAGHLPDDLRADLAGLLALLQASTMTGGSWLDAAAQAPELAHSLMRARVRKRYGVPARDEPPP